MKIKVNKYQYLDNYEVEYQRYARQAGMKTSGAPTHDFETVDVTVDELLDYIEKGYGIKINC